MPVVDYRSVTIAAADIDGAAALLATVCGSEASSDGTRRRPSVGQATLPTGWPNRQIPAGVLSQRTPRVHH